MRMASGSGSGCDSADAEASEAAKERVPGESTSAGRRMIDERARSPETEGEGIAAGLRVYTEYVGGEMSPKLCWLPLLAYALRGGPMGELRSMMALPSSSSSLS